MTYLGGDKWWYPTYIPLSTTPALMEDVTVSVPAGVTYVEAHAAIVKAAGQLLELATLLTVYIPDMPEAQPADMRYARNMTFALVFRHRTDTLPRAAIMPVMNKIRAIRFLKGE